MKNSEKKLGASLWVLGMMISGNVLAQSCVFPPTCEELGYDKVASDCGSLAKLKCPFDDSKYFCTAYTDMNGKKIAEIGDYVYTDAISAEPISGRIPVGIVYDLSGKMMSLAQFSGDQTSKCASYATDGVAGWSLPALEDMGLIKSNITKINSQLAKIPNIDQIKTNTAGNYETSRLWKTTEKAACMIADQALTANSVSGCDRDYENFSTRLTEQHVLCIRTFSSDGAGANSIPEVNLSLGDDYKDDTGTIIGTVIAVNGDKGVIVNRAVRYGTRDEAISYCEQLKTGGLTWFLPSFEQMVKVCDVNASGFNRFVHTATDYPGYWVSDTGYYTVYEYTKCSEAYNNSGITGSKSYFCAAAF